MKHLLLSFAFCSLLSSCTQEDLIVEKSLPTKVESRSYVEVDSIENFTLKCKFNDVLYDVPCQLIGDSLIYQNKEFENLFINEISINPNIVTYIDENGVIEYFISKEKFERANKLKFVENTQINTPNAGFRTIVGDYSGAGEAILYDDNGCTDSHNLTMTIGYQYMLDIPRLKSYNMNDKTSSIQVKSYVNDPNLRVVLIAFENDTYNLDNPSKAELYCVASYGNMHEDLNLKRVPAHGRDSWNDRISSTRLRIATADLFNPHP